MLKNNKVNLLISIVAAIVLWGYVTLGVNPQQEFTVTSVPVELTNREALYDRSLTVADSGTYSVDVVVIGARSIVTKLTEADFKATADLTGYHKGSNNVAVKVTTSADVEIQSIVPDVVPVVVVDRITVTKPVRLLFADEFAKDEEPGFITVAPSEMEVSGTAAAVESVSYIRVEMPEGMLSEEALTIQLDAVAINRDGNQVYNVDLSQNRVEVTATLCTTKTVPLRVSTTGETPETVEVTYKYVPSLITIRGTKEAIKDITEIQGREVNLSQIYDTTEIPVDPYLPSGVETANLSENLAVKVEVQGIEKKELVFTAEMVDIIGLPDRLSGYVNTGVITVTVFATAETLKEVTLQTVRLSIDASEIALAAEQVEMDVNIDCDFELSKATVEPAKLRVTFMQSGSANGGQVLLKQPADSNGNGTPTGV